MQWHSASEFFAMGGYAVYVWGSFGACALSLLLETLLLRRRRGQLLQRLRAQHDEQASGGQALP